MLLLLIRCPVEFLRPTSETRRSWGGAGAAIDARRKPRFTHCSDLIGHRYFDAGRYKADPVCKIATTSYLIEYDMTHYEGLPGDRQLGVGAVDVQDPKAESGETVAAPIREYKWLAPEQTIITSSCGFNHLPRIVAAGKLRAMSEAKRILGG